MRPQLNLVVGDDIDLIVTQFDGIIPRTGETVFLNGADFVVENVVHEFASGRQAHVIVVLERKEPS